MTTGSIIRLFPKNCIQFSKQHNLDPLINLLIFNIYIRITKTPKNILSNQIV